MSADVDYKKVFVSEVSADGGLGRKWKLINDVTRTGTATFVGSEADVTTHKNVNGGIIASSQVDGDFTFDFQSGDVTAANSAYLMGGTVTTSAEGTNYKAPTSNQAIYRSVMVLGTNNTIIYATKVKMNTFPSVGDSDLWYLQVNGLVEQPDKEGEELYGTWDSIDATANDITAFELDEQSAPASIDNVNHTVAITVLNGTDPSDLSPIIDVSLGADVKSSNAKESGDSEDFTSPVTYTVTAANGIAQDWIITVTVA